MAKTLITHDNAAAMAKRSHEVRKAERLRKEAEQALMPLRPPAIDMSLVSPQDIAGLRLAVLAEAIEGTREALKQDMPPLHRASLARALSDLIERERVIAQRPGPGNLRPSAPTKQRRQAPVQPPNTSASAPVIDITPIATQDSKPQ